MIGFINHGLFSPGKFFLMISAIEYFNLKIENGRVIENIFPEKISHNLWKSNPFKKLVKKNPVKNVHKFTNFSCYKDNVKFDDIYDVFE